jgi:hypothetical protein
MWRLVLSLGSSTCLRHVHVEKLPRKQRSYAVRGRKRIELLGALAGSRAALPSVRLVIDG